MEIIIIALLAFAGYKLFRHTTRAGKEAVRAYVYLETLKKGVSQHEANILTDALLSDIGSDMATNAANMAKLEYTTVHRGKQLPMIGYAYRQGLRTTMPVWYRRMALSAPETLGIEVSYGRLATLATNGENPQADDEMRKDERYLAFYEAYANEVHRLSSKSADDLRVSDFMEHEPLHRAYRDGVDPLYLAAAFCDEHNQTKETFGTFESYYEAFLRELARYVPDNKQTNEWATALNEKPLRDAFASSMHPRRAAYGYYRFRARRQAEAAS
ncbi:hypothetical protein [Rhizobium laguerreae]|uniref:hypothetical protein n=1 Tax=Rhizobium laguerreae TaxID=1076926 RepID=UPI0021B101E5|nr:hypothetical protein [Rhizobium laguerreae]